MCRGTTLVDRPGTIHFVRADAGSNHRDGFLPAARGDVRADQHSRAHTIPSSLLCGLRGTRPVSAVANGTRCRHAVDEPAAVPGTRAEAMTYRRWRPSGQTISR